MITHYNSMPLTFTIFSGNCNRKLQMVGFVLIGLLVYFLAQFPCSSAGESSFGLSYYGGKIMTEPISVSILWLGTGWQETDRETIRNSINSITSSQYLVKDSEVPTLGNWWEIVRQYRDSNNAPVTDKVDLGAECFYTGPELNMTLDQVIYIGKSIFNKSSIHGFDGNLSCNRPFKMNDNSVYHVVFSYTVMFLDSKEQRELMDMCRGSFQVEVFPRLKVNMLWARAPQKAADQCSMLFHGNSYMGPPNGDEKIDSVVGYMLANIAEEVTNQDGRGWVSNDGSGMTISSSCDSPLWREDGGPPLFMDTERNLSFNAVGLNGYRYMVPYIWDQKISNCALKVSESCGTNEVISKEPKGYLRGGVIVNHSNGLQPYPPNQKCLWAIHYPTAKFIRFTINYLSVVADSDDHLKICKSKSKSAQCSVIQSNNGIYEKNLKLMSSKAYIEFRTGDRISFESRGWELSYSAGLCYGKEDLYNHDGIISYISSTSFPYVEGQKCQWVLHGKPGTPVFITFTHINISRGLDFLAIFNGTTMQQIANFSGFFTGSNLPQLNLSGEVVIAFTTQTNQGEGWSANFYISHPVNGRKKLLVVIIVVVLAFLSMSVSLVFVASAFRRKKLGHINTMDSNEGLMLIGIDTIGVENQIGEGPSAIVYRAISTDGIPVAVKSLRDVAAQTELEQEILVKCSSHPNIISCLGHSQDGLGRQYLVFEYMGMGDLSLNLRERGETLHWDKRIAIALQICSAIQMLHMYLKPPVYHGNITSGNILLDEFYNAKLGGFGAANYCSSNGRANPEQLSEMATDIWSFGLLLVELLRGEPLVNRHAYKNSRSLEETNELLGSQVWLDRRLDIPNEACKMAFLKFGEIAEWCIGSSWRVDRDKNNPKIGDVLSGLNQVKHLFCTASG